MAIGSGLSDLVDPGDSSDCGSIAKDVENLMHTLRLQPENTVLVGHSMGGIVVAILAARYTFAGAILLGPVLPKPPLRNVFESRIEMIEQGECISLLWSWKKRLRIFLDGMEMVANTIPEVATGIKASPTQKSFIHALLLSQDPNGYIALCNSIIQAERPVYMDASCPLLIFSGTDDKTCPMPDSLMILAE